MNETITKICSKCGSEYEAVTTSLLETKYDLSGGQCYECRRLRYEEQQRNEEATRLAEIAKKRFTWRSECGVPLKFMQAGFDTFDINREGNVKRVHALCLKYAEDFPIEYLQYIKAGKAYPSLLLFSTDVWGIGKTHLACAICHNILNRWNGEEITCPVSFCSEPDLYRSIQATYHYTSEERQHRENEDDIIRRLIYTPLLVLDDVGKEPRADPKFIQRILFAIIDGRYRKLRPIVLTTNKSPDELKYYLGGKNNQASYDRLWELTGGKFLKMTGKSYRRK